LPLCFQRKAAAQAKQEVSTEKRDPNCGAHAGENQAEKARDPPEGKATTTKPSRGERDFSSNKSLRENLITLRHKSGGLRKVPSRKETSLPGITTRPSFLKPGDGIKSGGTCSCASRTRQIRLGKGGGRLARNHRSKRPRKHPSILDSERPFYGGRAGRHGESSKRFRCKPL